MSPVPVNTSCDCCGNPSSGGGRGGEVVAVAHTIFQTAVSSNVYTDIFDMEIDVEGDGVSRMWIELSSGSLAVIAGNANPTFLRLFDVTDNVALDHALCNNPGASGQVRPVSMRYLLDPFTGTKTIKAQMRRAGAGTTTINGDGDQPRNMYLSATIADVP